MKVEISENVLKKMQEIAKDQGIDLKTKEDYEKFIETLVDFHM
jgi:hypothetical protein